MNKKHLGSDLDDFLREETAQGKHEEALKELEALEQPRTSGDCR